MKNLKLLLVLLIFTVNITCENNYDSCPACGSKNPTEEIPWIKSSIMVTYALTQESLYKIDLYEFKGQQVIQYNWRINDAYDLPTGAIYDCSGNLLYYCGGNQPIDSCAYILKYSNYIGNIWTK